MTAGIRQTPWESRVSIATLAVLVLCRLPAFVAPAGSDQHLYMYVADRILDGGAPYVDAWDQKPPGIHFAYALLRIVWAHTSTVALLDLLTTLGTAAFLIVLGRRLSGPRAGYLAAIVFLAFGDPSIARLDGLYLRGQCETLIGVATSAALTLVWRPAVSPVWLIGAGELLAVAVWAKYNAVTYVLPLLFAAGKATLPLRSVAPGTPHVAPSSVARRTSHVARALWRTASLIAVGGLGPTVLVLIYLWSHGAVHDWWLATIDYNLQYSGETYSRGWLGGIGYALMLPVYRVKMDFLWFLGAVGLVLIVSAGRHLANSTKMTVVLWLVAAIGSILLNGARDLPQYFIQAKPVLALAFGLGLATLVPRPRLTAALTTVVLIIGLARVGTDAAGPLGFRWGGLPQAIENMSFDLDYARGRIDRATYLSRFTALQKYDAPESEALTALVRSTTNPAEPIFVFGFSPSVYLESGRTSASRFFWSRPVIVDFAAEQPGYGSRGLLADLEQARPSIVALQKKDWGPGEPTSYEFMLKTPSLRTWLDAGYTLERDTPFYGIWRRKP